jgi:hypothetical protein
MYGTEGGYEIKVQVLEPEELITMLKQKSEEIHRFMKL